MNSGKIKLAHVKVHGTKKRERKKRREAREGKWKGGLCLLCLGFVCLLRFSDVVPTWERR